MYLSSQIPKSGQYSTLVPRDQSNFPEPPAGCVIEYHLERLGTSSSV